MHNATYYEILITAVSLFSVIVFLWIMLIVNGFLRNPLKLSAKRIKKLLKNVKELNLSLDNSYSKQSDVFLIKSRKYIKVIIRYLRQYNYENDDDRIKNVTNKLQSIDISLSLTKKMCFQSGSKEVCNMLNPLIDELKEIEKIVDIIKDENILYESSYKEKYKKILPKNDED